MSISLNSINTRVTALESNGGYPNFSARVSRSLNTEYTESTNGWIHYITPWSQSPGIFNIVIGGVTVVASGTDAAWSTLSDVIPVKKGVKWKATSGRGSVSVWWIPANKYYLFAVNIIRSLFRKMEVLL